MNKFSTLLKDWRARHGLSERDAAIALNCGISVIFIWESGEYSPSAMLQEELIRRMKCFEPIGKE
jgi:transcriptional regulator with XRE-family HTH domain